MRTSRHPTVFFAAIFAKPASLTYGSAAAANFFAIGADDGTGFAGLTTSAQCAAIAAIITTVTTDCRAVLAQAAVPANHAALAAGFSAVGADSSIVSAIVAVPTQENAVTAHVAIRTIRICAIQALSAASAVVFNFLIALCAFRTMFIVVNGALHAHFAVIAPFRHAVGAISATRAAFTVTYNKTRSAIFTSRVVLQMANQAGIRTTASTLVTAFKAAIAKQTVVVIAMALVAVGAMLSLANGTFYTHTAVTAPFVHTFTAEAAVAGTRRMIRKTVSAFRAVKLLSLCALHTHFAIVAPFIHALGAITAAWTALVVTYDKACSAIRAGLFVLQMANQADIGTTAFALITAIKAAIAKKTVVAVTVTRVAVWAMLPLINCTFYAHAAVAAPFVYAFAATATAAGARRMIRKTVSAFRAVKLFILCALHTHFAIVAPFIHALGAITATWAALVVTLNKACSAILAGFFVFQVANQADIGTTAFALVAAIKAAIAKKTVVAVTMTFVAVGAMLPFVNGTLHAHAAVTAPFVRTFTASIAAAGARLSVAVEAGSALLAVSPVLLGTGHAQ